MLKLLPDTRIFIAVAPVDRRRSFSGLCAIIIETLRANPIGRTGFSSGESAPIA